MNDTWWLANSLSNLATVSHSQGDSERATELYEESMDLLQDDLGTAADLYGESLSLSWEIGLNPLVQSALEGVACLAGAKGEAERAARLWGAAQVLLEAKDIPRDPDFLAEADTRISAVRIGMGEEVWEQAWRRGRAMTLDEAVSYALEGEEAGT